MSGWPTVSATFAPIRSRPCSEPREFAEDGIVGVTSPRRSVPAGLTIAAVVTKPIEQKNGWVQIPAGPGFGIEIDRAGVDRFRIG
jgi:hypothetical protein